MSEFYSDGGKTLASIRKIEAAFEQLARRVKPAKRAVADLGKAFVGYQAVIDRFKKD